MAEVPVIDGYSELVQVAKGGFGVVYRARQDRFGRTVALKVLNVADLDDRGQQRFERECIAMGSLGWHPNVVAVFDSGITTDGHPWLSMEYLEAGSLGDRLKHGPLPWQEVVVAGIQVAGALGAAHAAGILHRDLKPENLLVGPFGETKLGDFGIAAVEGAARTTTGHASFTANHVAPEILRRQRPSEQSDLYSLASTLHTLIAGSPPFAGEPDEPIEAIITSVLTEGAPPLRGVPDDLADLLVRTLAKDPAERPGTADEFGRALQHVQADERQIITDLRLEPAGTASSPMPDRNDVADTVEPPSHHDERQTMPPTDGRDRRGDSQSTIVYPAIPDIEANADARQTQVTPITDASPHDLPPPNPIRPPAKDRRWRVVVGVAVGVAVLAAVLAGLRLRGDSGDSSAATTLVQPTVVTSTTPASVNSDPFCALLIAVSVTPKIPTEVNLETVRNAAARAPTAELSDELTRVADFGDAALVLNESGDSSQYDELVQAPELLTSVRDLGDYTTQQCGASTAPLFDELEGEIVARQ